nr:immunoglobulin heavy chain junction region [Macaca mulatta]
CARSGGAITYDIDYW